MPRPISSSRSTPGSDVPALSEQVEPSGSHSPSPERARPRIDGLSAAPVSSGASPPPRRPLRELLDAGASGSRGAADPLADWARIRAQLGSAALDGAQRLRHAQHAAQAHPAALLRHGVPSDVGSEADRLRLVLSALEHPAVTRESVDPSELAHAFHLDSTQALARVLAPLVERHGFDLTDCLAKLGLLHRADLGLDGAAWHFPLQGKPAALEVAKALLAFHPPDVWKACLKDEYHVIEETLPALDAPQLNDEQRLELAHLLVRRKDNQSMADVIERHFKAPDIRRELALTVAQHARCFDLDKLATMVGDPKAIATAQISYRLSSWPSTANRAPTNRLVSHLALVLGDDVQLTRQDNMDLYAHAVRTAGQLSEQQCVPWAKFHNAILKTYYPFELRASLAFWQTGDKAIAGAARLGLQSPFDAMVKDAARIPDDDADHRNELYQWILSATFMLGPQDAATMARLTPTLESLYHNARPAELRTDLTGALTDAMHIAGAKTVLDFIDSGQFHRPHMRAFAAALARLYVPDGTTLAPRLKDVLKHSKLKDGKRWQAVNRDLLTVVGSAGLSRQECKRLIELSAPLTQTGSGAVDALMKRLKLLAIATQAIETELVDGDAERHALGTASSATELDAVLNRIARLATPGSAYNRASADPRIQENWHRFMTDSRSPEALLGYTRRLADMEADNDADTDGDNDSEAPASNGQTELMDAMHLYADAVVWSANPAEAFAALRYDTTASDHLAYLAETAPDAWDAWRTQVSGLRLDKHAQTSVAAFDPRPYLYQRVVRDRHIAPDAHPTFQHALRGELAVEDALHQLAADSEEHQLVQLLDPSADTQQRAGIVRALIARLPDDTQFRRDLRDLKTLMTASPVAIADLDVVDTDHHEDLLLCGTEIAGSCQHVSGEPDMNKALLGYVIDGKYRMLAAKHHDDGPLAAQQRLAARRMLRLLVTEDGMPALHLERLYANPGIREGDAVDKALVELAKAKAADMGCALFADSDDDSKQQTLASLDSRAPFEYVDAEGDIMSREYLLEASRIA